MTPKLKIKGLRITTTRKIHEETVNIDRKELDRQVRKTGKYSPTNKRITQNS